MKKLLLSFFVLFCVGGSLQAQLQSTSPYSRFGLGEIEFGSSAALWAQGGVYTSIFDTNIVNYGNPASYSFLAKHRPLLDVAVSGRFNRFETAADTDYGNSTGLRNIVMGIPISKRTGASFGLTPFSSSGYNIRQGQVLSDGTDVDFLYTGDGGINRLYGGVGIKVLDKTISDSIRVKTRIKIPVHLRTTYNDSIKDTIVRKPANLRHQLSIGGNASFLFGTLSKSRRIQYESGSFLNTLVESSVRVADVMWDFGIAYQGQINDKTSIQVGATYGLSSDLFARRDIFSASYTRNAFGIEEVQDTIASISDVGGIMRLPKSVSYGIGIETTIGKRNSSDLEYGRLRLSLQGSQTEWNDYLEIFDGDTINDNFRNSRTWSVGLEIQPQVSKFGEKTRYYKLINYRLGFTTTQSFLSLNDNRIDDYGIRFGLGMPLINTRSISSLNFGFELGQRGTINNNLIKESYFGMFIGFSLSPNQYNLWFRKRKYD